MKSLQGQWSNREAGFAYQKSLFLTSFLAEKLFLLLSCYPDFRAIVQLGRAIFRTLHSFPVINCFFSLSDLCTPQGRQIYLLYKGLACSELLLGVLLKERQI